MQYRKEVDGLRAVAVVPVVLFHAGFSWIKGGFIGVDVFFVISGYLITSLIVLDKTAAKFSIIEFYERRARRILPPLFVMVGICILPAIFLMAPIQLKQFGEGIAAVSLFLSNVLFFFHSSYFAADAGENPLLHTWTLAVEEQYYVLFPILVALLWRFGRTVLAGAVVIVALVSFAFIHLGGSFDRHFPFIDRDWVFVASSFAFYLTPGRAWELMLGALVALALPGGTVRYSWLSEIMAAIGLVLIAAAFLTFSETTPSPSIYTLMPTLGTVAVLLFATPQTMVGKVLGTRPFVWLGLISYSVYLWHQPIFAFVRLSAPTPPSLWVFAILSAATLPVGYLSWRFIEQPFRNRERFTRAQIFSIAAVVSASFVALGVWIARADGFIDRYPPSDRALLMLDPEEAGHYVELRYKPLEDEFDQAIPGTKLLIIGDSYSQDLVNMIGENHLLGGYQIRTFYIPFICQIVIPPIDSDYCRKASLANPSLQYRLHEADIIILTSDWKPEVAAQLPATLRTLNLRPNQKLIVIGTKKFSKQRPLTYLNLSPVERVNLRVHIAHLTSNDILRRELPVQTFVDFSPLVCPQDTCPVFTPSGKLISFDGSHLTPDGAIYAGRLLFQAPPLKALEAGNRHAP